MRVELKNAMKEEMLNALDGFLIASRTGKWALRRRVTPSQHGQVPQRGQVRKRNLPKVFVAFDVKCLHCRTEPNSLAASPVRWNWLTVDTSQQPQTFSQCGSDSGILWLPVTERTGL
jgi:hypothetical protein